jgi:hypothetical protein
MIFKTLKQNYSSRDTIPLRNTRASRCQEGQTKGRKEGGEINLLDGKRSLNINIFLKQFRRLVHVLVTRRRVERCQLLPKGKPYRFLCKIWKIDSLSSF